MEALLPQVQAAAKAGAQIVVFPETVINGADSLPLNCTWQVPCRSVKGTGRAIQPVVARAVHHVATRRAPRVHNGPHQGTQPFESNLDTLGPCIPPRVLLPRTR